VTVSGTPRRVEFSVDDHRVWVARSAPWQFGRDGSVDTTKLEDGSYTLTVRAVGDHGAAATATITVTVANG
jgi:hypothetical protein